MEWITAIRKALNYMEEHLCENIGIQEIAEQVYISPVHLQKGFQVLTGYSVSEYLRNRRMYLAALELRDSDRKVIDTAFAYGYETPESFTKAFTRFHGRTPSAIKDGGMIRTFLPLSVELKVYDNSSI